jgi:hypothetical protein
MGGILANRFAIVPTALTLSERGLCRRNRQLIFYFIAGNQRDLRNDEERGQVLALRLKELVGVCIGAKFHRCLQR